MRHSFCPLIFLTLNWDCKIICKKWLCEKHFLWSINDKWFFLRKWSRFFLAFVYFRCLVVFHSVIFWSPLKALGFQSSTVWLCCFLVLLLWCVFCQGKFTGTLAYLTSTMSHKALLRRKFHVLWWDFLCLSISPSLLHLSIPPWFRYKSQRLLLIGIALNPGFNSLVPGNSIALVLQ